MQPHFPSNSLLIAGAILVTLTACGGASEGSSEHSPGLPPPLGPVTLSGNVVSYRGEAKTVCLDLNRNSACDASEPATAVSTDSNYELRIAANAISGEQLANTSLIALLESPSGQIVLRQVPGKQGQISSLSTLLAEGVAVGMTEAEARANTIAQLPMHERQLDDIHQTPRVDASQVNSDARTMSIVVEAAMLSKARLEVGNQSKASDASAGDLISLRYEGSADYAYQTHMNSAKAAGSLTATFRDLRTVVESGIPVTNSVDLYPTLYSSVDGWKRCNERTEHEVVHGNPRFIRYCGISQTVDFTVSEDISGQSMVAVITSLRNNPQTNTVNLDLDATALLANVGDAVFPPGSLINQRSTVKLGSDYNTAIDYTRSDVLPQSAGTTLESMVAAYPASAANLLTGAGTLALGKSFGTNRNVRAAFTNAPPSGGQGETQLYECQSSLENIPFSCVAAGKGSYTIASRNGARLLYFSAASMGNYLSDEYGRGVGYLEVKGTSSGDHVYKVGLGTPNGGGISEGAGALLNVFPRANVFSKSHLNGIAWSALKERLALK